MKRRRRLKALAAGGASALTVAMAAAPALAAGFDNDSAWNDEAAISQPGSGNVVGFLQAQMFASKDAMGISGNICLDGVFGSLTTAATRDFQRTVGITQDGVVGTVTWGELRSFQPWIRTDPANTQEAVVYVGPSTMWGITTGYDYSYYGGTAANFSMWKNSATGGTWKWNSPLGGGWYNTSYTTNSVDLSRISGRCVLGRAA